MDLLVALAAVSAYAYSTFALGFGRTDVYYDVTVAVILVVSVGGYYERRMKRRALGTLADLTQVRLKGARRENGTTVNVEKSKKATVSSSVRLLCSRTKDGAPKVYMMR
jgi:Cu2+-exporting ATPase